jgi:hypothetical protein
MGLGISSGRGCFRDALHVPWCCSTLCFETWVDAEDLMPPMLRQVSSLDVRWQLDGAAARAAAARKY